MRQKPQQIWQQKTQISPQLFLLSHQIKQLLQQWPGHLAELARSTETGPTGVKKSISLHNYIRIRQQIVLLIQINLICLIAIKKLPANLRQYAQVLKREARFHRHPQFLHLLYCFAAIPVPGLPQERISPYFRLNLTLTPQFAMPATN